MHSDPYKSQSDLLSAHMPIRTLCAHPTLSYYTSYTNLNKMIVLIMHEYMDFESHRTSLDASEKKEERQTQRGVYATMRKVHLAGMDHFLNNLGVGW